MSASAVRDSRRGIVLLLVVVIVTISAMIGGTAAMATASERGAATAARDLAQARAAAWSGLQGVMAELSEQRDAILAGEAPVVTESWELEARADGRRSLVRLVDLEPGHGLLVPEAGQLDVNAATKQMLVDLGLEDGLAGRIVEARTREAFASVEDLRRVSGVTAAMLPGISAAGAGDEIDSSTGGGGGGGGGDDGSSSASSTGRSGSTASVPNLSDLLTVFAFDPNIQSGLGERGEEFRGRQRVNLDQAWSDRLNDALVERFGEDAARGVERIMNEGTTFATDKDIVKTLRRLTLPPESWGEILDIFTTSDDEYLIGRVDLRTAPEAVLAALPGVSVEQAREIVAARDRLAPELMGSAAWLVTQGILTQDDFEIVVDSVTTRCMQWRVRVEGGLSFAESGVEGIGGPVGGTGGEIDPAQALTPRVVLEAVVDISSQRVRVAYLRDVTLMETAEAILNDPGLAEELGLGAGISPDNEQPEELDDARAVEPTQEDGAGQGPGGGGAPMRGEAGDGTEFDSPGTPGGETSHRPGRARGAEGASEGGDVNGSGDSGGSGQTSGSGTEFKDRRIGRWTSRGGGA